MTMVVHYTLKKKVSILALSFCLVTPSLTLSVLLLTKIILIIKAINRDRAASPAIILVVKLQMSQVINLQKQQLSISSKELQKNRSQEFE